LYLSSKKYNKKKKNPNYFILNLNILYNQNNYLFFKEIFEENDLNFKILEISL
jgi:hypothetical protein